MPNVLKERTDRRTLTTVGAGRAKNRGQKKGTRAEKGDRLL